MSALDVVRTVFLVVALTLPVLAVLALSLAKGVRA